MSTDNKNHQIEFLTNWQNNKEYFDMLDLMSSLSRLFSENSTPYLDYRLAENLFCKYFNAYNDARTCTAYDARIDNLGIGIKTFIISNNSSVEKIAEFNKLKQTLDKVHGEELAHLLAQYRNDRISLANNLYDVNNSLYHIVGRKEKELVIFNTPYNFISIDTIENVKETATSISFNDNTDYYSFNKSKSVLMKRFDIAEQKVTVPIEILQDPLALLSELMSNRKTQSIFAPEYKPLTKGIDYIVLPLYSMRGGTPNVPKRSGLNQWNANGRKRDENEVYIPIPKMIHKKYPDFFPEKDVVFDLILPNGRVLSASICQADKKALMSNPNSDLGEWILRRVLNKRPGELVTINDLNHFGIDSVLVEKIHPATPDDFVKYKISFASSLYEDYKEFIAE